MISASCAAWNDIAATATQEQQETATQKQQATWIETKKKTVRTKREEQVELCVELGISAANTTATATETETAATRI